MSEPLPPLPADLQPYTIPTGVHNRWPSISVFGPWKSGKSVFLSSFPPPMVAIDAGDQGMGMYLPQDDPRYVCIQTSDPNRVNQVVDWAVDNEDKINSFIIDPATMLWKEHLDWFQEFLGVEEIKGGQWKEVKGPWARRFMKLRRASFYKGYSFRIKDIEYATEGGGPGEKGPLIIRAHEAPDWEKNMGYLCDQIYECQNKKDSLGKPTPTFEVTFWGGRRPRSVPPEELPIGRTWKFDSRKPESVWDAVIAPYMEAYQVDALEHYGVDEEQAAKALQEMKQDVEDGNVGRLIREVEEFKGSLKDYQKFFPRIARESASLSGEGKARVKAAHEKRKGELK
jgi:hypothetical protein